MTTMTQHPVSESAVPGQGVRDRTRTASRRGATGLVTVVLAVLGAAAAAAPTAAVGGPTTTADVRTVEIDPSKLPIDTRLQPPSYADHLLAYGSDRTTLARSWREVDLVAATTQGYVLTATYKLEERRRLLHVSRSGVVRTITTYPTDRAARRLGYAVASPSGDKVALTLDKPDGSRSVWMARIGEGSVVGAFALAPYEYPMAISDAGHVLLTNETWQDAAPARTWWRSRTGTQTEVAAVDVALADLRSGTLVTVTYPGTPLPMDEGPRGEGSDFCSTIVRLEAPTTPVGTLGCGTEGVRWVDPTGRYLLTQDAYSGGGGLDAATDTLRTVDGTAIRRYTSPPNSDFFRSEPWFTADRQVFSLTNGTDSATVTCAVGVAGACVRVTPPGAEVVSRDVPNTTGPMDLLGDSPPVAHYW